MKRLAAATLPVFTLTASIALAQVFLPSEVELIEGREPKDNAAAFIEARYAALDAAAVAFVTLAQRVSAGLPGNASAYDQGLLVLYDEQFPTANILEAYEAGPHGKEISPEGAAALRQSLRERRSKFIATAESAKKFEQGMREQCGVDFSELTRYFVGGARTRQLIEKFSVDQLAQLISSLEAQLSSAGYKQSWDTLLRLKPQQMLTFNQQILSALHRYYRGLAIPPPVNAEVRHTLAVVMHQALVLYPQEKVSEQMDCSGLNSYLEAPMLQELFERLELTMAKSGTAD